MDRYYDRNEKAKKWLEANEIEFLYHDYRTDGIDASWLEKTESQLGWQQLLNQRGTTFRQLDAEQKADLNSHKAIQLMLAAPAMIKRPVLIKDDHYFLGFKPDQYKEIFEV